MTDIEGLLSSLQLDEKVKLVAGESFWRTHPIESAGIPVLKVSDGPNGVRGDGGVAAASFPVGICMASTWNKTLIQQVGDAIADEANSKDVQVVLGPTINLHRTPLGGRNFECYSEDPFLSGMLASAFTDGIQAKGVGACLKHFVCNDSEFERHTISVEIDQRTLREVYLRPFEIAIERSRPWTVMASYNRINGVYACSHDELVNNVLKKEWGFDGLVISDWFAAKETVANALGGLDLEMPGPAVAWGDELLKAAQRGDVPESVIDDKVRRLLRLLQRSGRFEDPLEKAELGVDQCEHRKIAYQAAVEGMVLLKNEQVLPLKKADLNKLAVIGPNTKNFRIMGGGSSSLRPHYVKSPLDVLQETLATTQVRTAIGCTTHKFIPEPERHLLSPAVGSNAKGLRGEFYEGDIGSQVIGERVIAAATIHIGGKMAAAQSAQFEGFYEALESGAYEFGLLSTGQARMYVDDKLVIDNWQGTEPGEAFFMQATSEKIAKVSLRAGSTVSIKIEFKVDASKTFKALRYGVLAPQSEDSIADAVDLARDSDAVVLMVGTNDDWETEGNDRETLSLPGQQDELIRRVLDVNSNTVIVNNSGAPITMPWFDQAPAVIQSWFAGQEFGNALTDILLGTANPSGKLPITFPRRLEDTPAFTNYPGEFGRVHYGEGLFVGYRWYESRDILPLVPFGHGLSYTTFEYSDLKLSETEVNLQLANTGEHTGLETVQVYIEAINPLVSKPKIELRGFEKIQLQPNESKSVIVQLDTRAFEYWNELNSAWEVLAGEYAVHVGSSSRDIRLLGNIEIQA
ncbi:MAG: glycoside hydrolase family 3 C-terminal domain-containing protein [Pseudomonadales bacterium]|nr:glycoside hydrolase family 3 C-terminal domain-containing protein [Pseudomonadales bacterium]MDG1443225.1 glycoside hydrolase family 3 C-terminal domain-containing protein [Pseudomonadales bacterium]